MLESLSCVNEVITLDPMHTDQEYSDLVVKVHPHIIAITKGDKAENKKRNHAKSVGADVVVIEKIHTPSTSQLAKLLELE